MSHVAVLMGGFSSERNVSLLTGEVCSRMLESIGYKVTRIDVDRSVSTTLEKLKPDVVFNALHGPYGEDGTIQGILEYLAIPYTHSGVTASALAMNKSLSKTIVHSTGLPVAESKIQNRLEISQQHPMKPPYVIKPINEGSSFGVLIVREGQSIPTQELCSSKWLYGDLLMVERFIYGRELSCAVMGNVTLGVTEIIIQESEFYNHDSKYGMSRSQNIIPAHIPPKVYQKIQTLSLKAHLSLGCRGITRSDFRWDDRGKGLGELIWLELNTQPGMTSGSLFPKLAQYAGYGLDKLLTWIVKDASCCR